LNFLFQTAVCIEPVKVFVKSLAAGIGLNGFSHVFRKLLYKTRERYSATASGRLPNYSWKHIERNTKLLQNLWRLTYTSSLVESSGKHDNGDLMVTVSFLQHKVNVISN